MATAGKARVNPALRLASIRQIHVYLGVVIAPSVLFFAVTGALQLFSLHEAHGAYRPPAIIEALAGVHKDQVFATKPAAASPAEDADPRPTAADHDHDHDHHDHDAPKIAALVLKWLFLLVAIGLVTSTSLGLWMAIQYNRNKRLIWALLLVGALAPVLALLI